MFYSTDLEMISFTMDGNSIESAPSKGAYDVSVTCNNEATGYWDYEEWGPDIRNITTKTKCSIAFTTRKYMSDYIISLNNSNVSNVEKIEHVATAQTPALTDYRYTGSNPNNYVYFGCNDNCTEDNLYRIIGVIPTQSSTNGEYENRVKLIKADSYLGANMVAANYTIEKKGYLWNNGGSNNWESSSLKNTLNGVYWNSLGEYQKYIEPAKWYLGATSFVSGEYVSTTLTPNLCYKNERSNIQSYSKGAISYIANIGLMYPSDYGYAIGSNYADSLIKGNASVYKANSWLSKVDSHEWTISPVSNLVEYNTYGMAIRILLTGPLAYNLVDQPINNGIGCSFRVRPTFYLKADIYYSSGEGTSNNPYRLNV